MPVLRPLWVDSGLPTTLLAFLYQDRETSVQNGVENFPGHWEKESCKISTPGLIGLLFPE
jgi:hypothetical protein